MDTKGIIKLDTDTYSITSSQIQLFFEDCAYLGESHEQNKIHKS